MIKNAVTKSPFIGVEKHITALGILVASSVRQTVTILRNQNCRPKEMTNECSCSISLTAIFMFCKWFLKYKADCPYLVIVQPAGNGSRETKYVSLCEITAEKGHPKKKEGVSTTSKTHRVASAVFIFRLKPREVEENSEKKKITQPIIFF